MSLYSIKQGRPNHGTRRARCLAPAGFLGSEQETPLEKRVKMGAISLDFLISHTISISLVPSEPASSEYQDACNLRWRSQELKACWREMLSHAHFQAPMLGIRLVSPAPRRESVRPPWLRQRHGPRRAGLSDSQSGGQNLRTLTTKRARRPKPRFPTPVFGSA